MNYFWTVQSKKVLDIVNNEDTYYPIFTTSKKDYNIVLESFNMLNKTEYKGLVFGFAKGTNKGNFKNIEELYSYFLDNPLVTNAFNFWDNDHVILQLEIREDFNQIPIDFNDFNQITFPIWGKDVNNNIISLIKQGRYNEKCILPSFTQIHFPYIKKDNIVQVFGNFNKKDSLQTGELKIFSL